MAMALVHANIGFPFLAKSIYDYLCGVPLGSIHICEDEVPNYEVRTLLQKVSCNFNALIIKHAGT